MAKNRAYVSKDPDGWLKNTFHVVFLIKTELACNAIKCRWKSVQNISFRYAFNAKKKKNYFAPFDLVEPFSCFHSCSTRCQVTALFLIKCTRLPNEYGHVHILIGFISQLCTVAEFGIYFIWSELRLTEWLKAQCSNCTHAMFNWKLISIFMWLECNAWSKWRPSNGRKSRFQNCVLSLQEIKTLLSIQSFLDTVHVMHSDYCSF